MTIQDPNMMWDFFSLRPESTHQVMILFGDRGIPDGFRHMDGFGSHTFKLVNKDGNAVYCKFHVKTAQGIRNLPPDVATKLAGEDPDYSIRDLYDSIENGDYPIWHLMIQVMTFEEAANYRYNPFDLTKVWSHKEFPLIPIGKIVLNKNPSNYFAEVEQIAFAPSHVVPGIEFSPDKMLQGRLFAYPDTQFHRLGPNYVQLPINCPYRSRAHNTQRDGGLALDDNQGGMPSYHPNSFNGAIERTDVKDSGWSVSGDVDRFNDDDEDNFSQPRDLWLKVMDEAERDRLVNNIASSLKFCKTFIQERAVDNFTQVHQDFGNALRNALQKANAAMQKKREETAEFNAKESIMMPCAIDNRMKNISNLAKHCKY